MPNKILQNLKRLAILDKVDIEKNDCNEYEIRVKNYGDIVAIVDEDGTSVNYYLTGCYDSGLDYLQIDLEQLDALKAAVEELRS